jgi:serine/threonine protein phosphatase PrpC
MRVVTANRKTGEEPMVSDNEGPQMPASEDEDAPSLELHVGFESDVGSVREVNQDFVDCRVPDDEEERRQRGAVFLVADGMGGHRAGEVASREAVEWVKEEYYTDLALDVDASLVRAYEKANAFLYDMAQADPSKLDMGTTLVAAVFQGTPPQVTIANVGDSRAYLLRGKELTQITSDHSLVEGLVQTGHLTPSEAEIHPQRSVITRAMGIDPSVEVDLFEVEICAGDRLLLCTDGLTNELSDKQIARIARSYPPAEAAAQLVDQANAAGGRDNVSVLVVQAGPVATSSRRPFLGPVQDWLRGQAKSETGDGSGRRRWVALLATVAVLLFLGIIGAVLLMPNRQWASGPAAAPHLAPIQPGAEGVTGDLVSSPSGLWPPNPGVFLVGTVRHWRCEGQDCAFELDMAGTTFRAKLDREYFVDGRAGVDAQTGLETRQVRIFGVQPVEGEQVDARLIDLGERWWALWEPAWVTVYEHHDWSETVWVYTVLDRNPYGVVGSDVHPGLARGTGALVRGRWLEGGPRDNMAFAIDRAYLLQGDEYVPVSDVQVLAPLSTVTLNPTGAVTSTAVDD